MRRDARRVILGLVAVAFGSVPATTLALVPDLSDPTHCPGVIAIGPGSYQLTADVSGCSIMPTVGSISSTTIDLAGHTWSGSAVFLTGDNNRLTNGTFDHSTVWLAGMLDHVTMRNGHDFSLEAFGFLTVADSTFESNEIGLSAYFGSASVEDSAFRDNHLGLVIGRGSGSSVETSEFQDNQLGLMLWDEDNEGSDDVTVRENHFSGNVAGLRVSAVSAVARARIEGNQIEESGAVGLDVVVVCDAGPVCGGQDMRIEKNHLRRNGFAAATPEDGDGIRVRGEENVTQAPVDPSWITLSGNQSDRNAALGIDAPGVTDGGKNRAKFNGDPQQCVGVDCNGPAAKRGGKRKRKAGGGAQVATQSADQLAAPSAAVIDPLESLLASLPRHRGAGGSR